MGKTQDVFGVEARMEAVLDNKGGIMNAEDALECLDQLSRADKVTLLLRLLKPVQPDKSEKFDLAAAMRFIVNAPPVFKYPISQMLVEAEKVWGGDLSNEDVINLAVILLRLCQDHQGIPRVDGLTAAAAYDFVLEAHLEKIMMRI